ncbi:MAG: 4Fe-4S binding protein [bacterium]
MALPLWMVKLIKRSFPWLFTAARATRVPVLGRVLERALFEDDRMIYLPRESTLKVERQVDTAPDLVLPSAVVDHFIDRAGYLWIMNECICRVSNGCSDYPVEVGCLFMGEAARDINPALGREVTREEAREHVQKAREAGLVHVIGRNKLDSVWLWVSPKEKLLTVCNCCPCCCLWRAVPYFDPAISANVSRMPGVEVEVTDECTGCGECVDTCFVGAVHMEGEQAVISSECRGCGRCVEACPTGAIHMEVDLEKAVRESIDRISPLVDLS